MHPRRRKIETSLRFAGLVGRYHTWPTLRKQTIAEHTWHMLRLYERIWGKLHELVTAYILYHDVGENRSGDMPFLAKVQFPDLRRGADAAEAQSLADMGIVMPRIGDALKRRVKVCDLIEMWEFGTEEFMMGNQYATPIIEDTLTALDDVQKLLPPEDQERLKKYRVNQMGRTVCT